MKLRDGYGVQIFGPFRGAVLQHRQTITWLLSGWIVVLSLFWLTRTDRVWFDGWWLFWGVGTLAPWGGALALAPIVFVWFLIPLGIATWGRGAEGYVRFPAEDRLRRSLLAWLTGVATILSTIIAPAGTIELYRSSLRVPITWVLGLLASAGGVSFAVRTVRTVWRRKKREGKDIRRFPDEVRPINTQVVNLDVGALAPTLDVVARGLEIWARVVGGSAPTAKRLWRALIDPRTNLPVRWQRSLSGLALSTVEDFRGQVAELVCVRSEAVVFLTSTTRAIDAVMESVGMCDGIVTTDCEHSSEMLLVESHVRKKGIRSSVVKLLPLLTSDEEIGVSRFPELLAVACEQYARPILLVSEVPHCYGVQWPIAEMIREVRARKPETVVVVDGAHAVGHVPVNVGKLDCEFYAFSGHKWLYGPASLGILVLGQRVTHNHTLMESLRLECFESLAFAGSQLGEAGSTIALEPFVGLAEVLKRVLNPEARKAVFENIRATRRCFSAAIESCRSVRLLGALPADKVAPGIVNVQAKPGDLGLAALEAVRDRLEDRYQVVVKVMPVPASLRICLPYYLTLREIDRVVEALDEAFSSAGQ